MKSYLRLSVSFKQRYFSSMPNAVLLAMLVAGLTTLLSRRSFAAHVEFEGERGPQGGPFLPPFLLGQPDDEQVLYDMFL